ncbi:MAG: radical SAM protein, partial [Spirochaetaceae bacterium]|nr:radical SAM protein [Spirochaetaceae bacterium]
MRLITAAAMLPPHLAASLSPEEAAYIEIVRARGLPFAVTGHFASLAGPGRDDPIRRQFMPDPREELDDPFALADPLGEASYRVLPRLVRQYRNRALLKTTGLCGGCCRFCFRRVWMAEEAPFIPEDEAGAALAWLKGRPEIRELLLSGGDPLWAPEEAEKLISRIRGEFPFLR